MNGRPSLLRRTGQALLGPVMAVLVSMVVNVETGTSCPDGVFTFRSNSGPTLARSASPIWGMTL